MGEVHDTRTACVVLKGSLQYSSTLDRWLFLELGEVPGQFSLSVCFSVESSQDGISGLGVSDYSRLYAYTWGLIRNHKSEYPILEGSAWLSQAPGIRSQFWRSHWIHATVVSGMPLPSCRVIVSSRKYLPG